MRNEFPSRLHGGPVQRCLRGAAWTISAGLFTFSLAAQPQHTQPATDSLESRAVAAEAARNSGDADKIAAANRLVIASASSELADLRLVQSDYSGAAELYRQSIAYEDRPATYVSLGFAELQAGHLDQAVEAANKALAADAKNLRAERLLATALDQKGDYAAAIAPFTRIADAEPTVDNLYPLAECLLQTRKPEDRKRAEEVFERMKKIAGDSGRLHVLFGRAYRDGDDIQAAIREFRRALEIDPLTPHAHYFLGLAQLFANDWKPTPVIEEEFRKEAELYPGDYLANYMLGLSTSIERKYDESDKYLTAASRINPASPDPFLYLGINAFDQGKMDRAEAMLRKAVELTGTDEARTNYQIRRAYVDLTRILGQSGRMEESKVFAAKARALQNKTMIETQQSVSKMMADSGGGMGAAVVPMSKEQESQSAPAVTNKDDPSTGPRLTAAELEAAKAREKAVQAVLALGYDDLGTAYAVQKNYTQAIESYRQAEHWDAGLAGLEKNLGLCAFRIKDYATAAHSLALAIEHGENSAGVHAMLGLSYFAIDKYADAARAFDPLGERGMQDGEVGFAWAASLAHSGDLKKATQVLEQFESQPRSNDVLLLVGQLWTEIGDFARAVATLDRALESDPRTPKAHYYKGLAYIRWEHLPDAAREFKEELKIEPGDLDAMYHLGFVEQQQSNTADALALYLRVIAAKPDYANAQYEAGKILLDRDQLADAASHLEIAANLNPEKDYIHYQLQAAYRKLGKTGEADHELEIYKNLKARSRERVADKLKQQTQ
jgi:tetratricopeptide (TPR) repeat protein